MASQDLVALDIAAAKIVGIDARSIRHIMLASWENIENTFFIPKGIAPEYFECRYPRKGASNKVMLLVYRFVRTVGLEVRLGL